MQLSFTTFYIETQLARRGFRTAKEPVGIFTVGFRHWYFYQELVVLRTDLSLYLHFTEYGESVSSHS